jgi:hypothetical protein
MDPYEINYLLPWVVGGISSFVDSSSTLVVARTLNTMGGILSSSVVPTLVVRKELLVIMIRVTTPAWTQTAVASTIAGVVNNDVSFAVLVPAG